MKIPHVAQVSILALIVIIGVVLLIAMSGKPAAIPASIPTAVETSLEGASAIVEPTQGTETEEPGVVLGDALYNNFDATIAQSNIVDSISSLPLAGLEVKTYCDGKEGDLFIGKTFTDENGLFTINAQEIFSACDYGTKAWFEVEYNGYIYSSPKIDIPEKHINGGGSSHRGQTTVLMGAQATAAHMPEFSAATLALAVIGAGLVLAMFRKK